jgi:integrase
LASIKKIHYRKKDGKISTHWQVSYYDSAGKRQRKNYKKQSDANAHRVTVESELLTGSHIPENNSVTLNTAASHFINSFERDMIAGNRERSTWKQYRSHINLHIIPYSISSEMLNTLKAPTCRKYLDDLQAKIGDNQAAKVMVTLRMILNYSAERGWIQGNPASSVRVKRATRRVKKLVFPSKGEVKKLIEAAKNMGLREHAFCCLGFFCGLRPSEIRGFPVSGIKLGSVLIDQRADQWGRIGAPKTSKSHRTVPMGKYTSEIVQKWAKERHTGLLFPSENGTPINYQNLYNRFWKPLHIAAGLYKEKTETEEAKGRVYTLHTMRHVAASLWIEQGYNPKRVQEMLGHATLAMTMDTYGHLFQTAKESRSLVNKAEKSILDTK